MDIPSLILLSRVPGLGPRRLKLLIDRFGDPRAVLRCELRELAQIPEIDARSARALLRAGMPQPDRHRPRIERQLERLHRMGGRVLTLWDPSYPPGLAAIHDAPPLLFLRGSSTARHDPWMLAIVGTRHPTPYGARCAQEFSRCLAAAGFTVVSGLARGIDTLAHQSALDAGGRTIAILGSGVDVIYPPENGVLADRIVERGALISELEMGSRPHAAHFPRRNRIISGMCIGTLVVETGPRGGAMITAAMALEQNREVFAIPSAVDLQRPSGTNLLIKRGEALLVERPEELMHELEPLLPALQEHREAEWTTGNAEPSSV